MIHSCTINHPMRFYFHDIVKQNLD